ncbi:MAG: hypothetical protein N2322_05965, partial [Terrimicrobiaceae bacterium]|nr:hypothetical protein [Terrimicrobiaceae bacterium]
MWGWDWEIVDLRGLAWRCLALACLGAIAGCASSKPEPLQAVSARRAQVVAQNPGGRVRFDGIFARDKHGASALDLYKGSIEPAASLRIT